MMFHGANDSHGVGNTGGSDSFGGMPPDMPPRQQTAGYPPPPVNYPQPPLPPQALYPPRQPAFPPQQPAFPPQQPAFPPQQAAFPAQQPGFPAHTYAPPAPPPNVLNIAMTLLTVTLLTLAAHPIADIARSVLVIAGDTHGWQEHAISVGMLVEAAIHLCALIVAIVAATRWKKFSPKGYGPIVAIVALGALGSVTDVAATIIRWDVYPLW